MLEGMMGEKPVYAGYPNKDREGNLISAVGGCLAISSKSGNKEAAWAFLQTLLTEDYQNSLVARLWMEWIPDFEIRTGASV